MENIAIVLAAGRGKRMQSETPKQFLLLKDRPVICRCLDCFQNSPLITGILVVTEEEYIPYCREEIVSRYGYSKVRAVISGGNERYDSVYQGLLQCDGADYVFVHDSARPFIDEALLERCFAGAREYGACIAAVRVKDTIKTGDENDFVKDTPDRAFLWSIQTPQVFSASLLKRAYDLQREKGMEGITDDAMVVEKALGHPVKLAWGSYRNIKITTPEDLPVALQILAEEL